MQEYLKLKKEEKWESLGEIEKLVVREERKKLVQRPCMLVYPCIYAFHVQHWICSNRHIGSSV